MLLDRISLCEKPRKTKLLKEIYMKTEKEACSQTLPKKKAKQRTQKELDSNKPETCSQTIFKKSAKQRTHKVPTPSYMIQVHDQMKTNGGFENLITLQDRKLGSKQFEFCLEYIWKSLSEEKRKSFTYLDCLWFDMYNKDKAKVLTWIKREDIFSRKYVFVPIVCWGHWRLLILCNLGKCESPANNPCMLLLDSLKSADPERLEPDVKKFIRDIYIQEGRRQDADLVAKIPFLVPKVPQQKNGEDCGIFVLYYTKLFVESAPEKFKILEGYPYFMNENWFNTEELEAFWKEVCSMVKTSILQPRQGPTFGRNDGDPWEGATLIE